jgi:adenine-specific DNA-methyltransferase
MLRRRSSATTWSRWCLGIADSYSELAPASETAVVFRDSAFADDLAKGNLAAILE